MTGNYTLIGQTPVLCEDLMEWARWYETADRYVNRTTVGHYVVSTVFLGLDHSFSGKGPPVLFETMIFTAFRDSPEYQQYKTIQEAIEATGKVVEMLGLNKELLEFQDRYVTWTDAEKGHEATVRTIEEKTGVLRTTVTEELRIP